MEMWTWNAMECYGNVDMGLTGNDMECYGNVDMGLTGNDMESNSFDFDGIGCITPTTAVIAIFALVFRATPIQTLTT